MKKHCNKESKKHCRHYLNKEWILDNTKEKRFYNPDGKPYITSEKDVKLFFISDELQVTYIELWTGEKYVGIRTTDPIQEVEYYKNLIQWEKVN